MLNVNQLNNTKLWLQSSLNFKEWHSASKTGLDLFSNRTSDISFLNLQFFYCICRGINVGHTPGVLTDATVSHCYCFY